MIELSASPLSEWIEGDCACALLGRDVELATLAAQLGARVQAVVDLNLAPSRHDGLAGASGDKGSVVGRGEAEAESADVVVISVPCADADAAVGEAARLLRPKGSVVIVGALDEAQAVGELLSAVAALFALEPPVRSGPCVVARARAGATGLALVEQWPSRLLTEFLGVLRAERNAGQALHQARERIAEETGARQQAEEQLTTERSRRERDVSELLEIRVRLARSQADLLAAERAMGRAVASGAAAPPESASPDAALEARLQRASEQLARQTGELKEARESVRRNEDQLDEMRARLAQSADALERLEGELEVSREVAAASRDEAEGVAATLAAERSTAAATAASLEATRAALDEELRVRKALETSSSEAERWSSWLRSELLETQRRLTHEIQRHEALLGGRVYRLQRAFWAARASRRVRWGIGAGVLVVAAADIWVGLAVDPRWFAVGAALILLCASAVLLGRPRERRRQPGLPLRSRATRLPEARSASGSIQAGHGQRPQVDRVEVDVERVRWETRLRAAPTSFAELRMAAICDEATRACLARECRLLSVPADWRSELEAFPPDLLFVESAWNGNNGQWQYQVAEYDHPDSRGRARLAQLVDWCRERDIPTVFWSNEPARYAERFAGAAALFDHVFTTNPGRQETLRALTPQVRSVEVLPFAAQPRIHNLIRPARERQDVPCFAGRYTRTPGPGPSATLDELLDAALPLGLVVLDPSPGADEDRQPLPERFAARGAGHLPYDELVEAYKRFAVFLAPNHESDPAATVPRAVFELLACGTPVLGTVSPAADALFGEHVLVARDRAEADHILRRILADPARARSLMGAAARTVFGAHTYGHRMNTIAERVGLAARADTERDVAVIAVIGPGDSAAGLRTLVDDLLAQEHTPREVLLGLAGPIDAGALARLERADGRLRTLRQEPEAATSERLRELARLAVSPWVAPLRPGLRLAPEGLADLLTYTRFDDVDVVGAPPAADDALTHRMVSSVAPCPAVARRELVASRGWTFGPEAEETMRGWFGEGTRFYAGDRLLTRGELVSPRASSTAG